MAAKSTVPLQKSTLRLRRGDVARLEELFPGVGYNVIIRTLVSRVVDQMNKRIEQEIEGTSTNDPRLPTIEKLNLRLDSE